MKVKVEVTYTFIVDSYDESTAKQLVDDSILFIVKNPQTHEVIWPDIDAYEET